MPIITDYVVDGYRECKEPIIKSIEDCLCPVCKKGILKNRSHVRRHIRKEDTGEKEWYWIPLGKCDNTDCKAMRRLLPAFMIPYKHYEEEAIADVLDEVITEESPIDYPGIQTMRRWIAWFLHNKDRIEGVFRNAGYQILGLGEGFLLNSENLLDRLKLKTDNWFRITVRFIYNSGHRLLPL